MLTYYGSILGLVDGATDTLILFSIFSTKTLEKKIKPYFMVFPCCF